MATNCDKPSRWKADIARSVDMYNDWCQRSVKTSHGGTVQNQPL